MTGQSLAPSRCSVAGCLKDATYARAGYEFCAAHRPTVRVTSDHVRQREMMLREDWSLASIAAELGVYSLELDCALFARIGSPSPLPTGGSR